jgi:polysaccharide export outer membrane protein
LTLLTLAAINTGCASKRPASDALAQGRVAESGGEYRIGVDDRLQISVWKNAELSVMVPVRPDGMISMPLIGDVKAGGLTTQVADNIKQRGCPPIREPSGGHCRGAAQP